MADRGGDRGGFSRGFGRGRGEGDRGRGDRGRGDRGRGPRRAPKKDEDQPWVPTTKLGRLVQQVRRDQRAARLRCYRAARRSLGCAGGSPGGVAGLRRLGERKTGVWRGGVSATRRRAAPERAARGSSAVALAASPAPPAASEAAIACPGVAPALAGHATALQRRVSRRQDPGEGSAARRRAGSPLQAPAAVRSRVPGPTGFLRPPGRPRLARRGGIRLRRRLDHLGHRVSAPAHPAAHPAPAFHNLKPAAALTGAPSSLCSGQDQEPRADLPLLSAHQGVPGCVASALSPALPVRCVAA